MKKKLFTVFGLGMIIGAFFFGTYVVYSAIQQEVGLYILDRENPSRIWRPIKSANLTGGGVGSSNIAAFSNMLLNNSDGTVTQNGTPGFDGIGPGSGIAAMTPLLFNGTTDDYDRQRSVTAANLTETVSIGSPLTVPLSTWSEVDRQFIGSLASASKAAGAAGVRHVATSITICMAAGVAPDNPVEVVLRDGATGAGTIMRAWLINLLVINETKCINLSGIAMIGTAATAMTLQFAEADAVGITQSVTLTGFSVN